MPGEIANFDDIFFVNPGRSDISPSRSRENFRVIASKRAPTHGPIRLFDGRTQPDSFWEVGPDAYPVELTITFEKQKVVTEYQFGVGENSSRMPVSWRLEGRSNVGQDWRILDEQDKQDWEVNSTDTFRLASPDDYKQYRFVFARGKHPDLLRMYELILR